MLAFISLSLFRNIRNQPDKEKKRLVVINSLITTSLPELNNHGMSPSMIY